MGGWSRRAVLASLVVPAASGCWGILLHGGPRQTLRSDQVEWGVVVLDIFVGLWIPPSPLGLIIDIADGTIYRPILHVDAAMDEPAGRLGVRVQVCADAPAPDRSLARWSRAFARHAAGCPVCGAALVADGSPEPMSPGLVGPGEVARADVVIPVDVGTDTALAAAREAAEDSMRAVAAFGAVEAG